MAADISQLKPIIVVCTVIALSFLLISWIPNGFYLADTTKKTLEAPEYFSAVQIERYGDIFNHTMNGTGANWIYGYYEFIHDTGGHTLQFAYPEANSTIYTSWIFSCMHCETWGIYPLYGIVNKHSLNFYHDGMSLGTVITRAHIITYGDTLAFEMSCNHINLDLFFGYNTTAYNTAVEAFDHNELALFVGVEWNEMATGMSAWDFVAAIMFFNLPDTHWMITAIIAVPLWIGLLYAAVTIILTILDLLPFT